MKLYHKIPKENISEREEYLKILHNRILLEDCASPTKKEHIVSHIEKRINYFKNLNFLYENEILYPDSNPLIYDKEKVKKVFFNTSENQDKNKQYEKRYLNNESLYDFKNNNYWGELWLEMLDPAHRELDFYKHQWLKDKSTEPFFTYLEKQNISHREPYINFVLDNELDSHKAQINNGLLHLGANALTSPDILDRHNETLFIINENTDIIVGISSPTKRHVSLSRGAPVLGGGLLVVKNGQIQEVKGNSGHYLFYTSHMLQTLEILKQKGIQLNDDIKITNFIDFHTKENLTLKDFYNKYERKTQNYAYQFKMSNHSRK